MKVQKDKQTSVIVYSGGSLLYRGLVDSYSMRVESCGVTIVDLIDRCSMLLVIPPFICVLEHRFPLFCGLLG